MKRGKRSGRVIAAEHVGSKLAPSDLLICNRFEGGPVVGVQQDLVVEPIRDVLLTDRASHELGESLRKSGLAPAGELNGPPERNNVRFLHEHNLYTNRFVRVNEPVCVTPHKGVCNVLYMPAAQRKTAAPKRSSKRVAIPGPDGKTLGQRVAEAMAHEGGRRHVPYEQKDLITDVNRLMTTEGDIGEPFSQQTASAIMRGKVSKSSFTPYIAKACHVDSVWLARGLGSMYLKP